MFLLDGDRDVSEAVVTARLPYDRVYISGSSEFAFLSNDVVRIPYAYLQCLLLDTRYLPPSWLDSLIRNYPTVVHHYMENPPRPNPLL